MKKRIISLLMVALMLVSLVPMGALAAGNTTITKQPSDKSAAVARRLHLRSLPQIRTARTLNICGLMQMRSIRIKSVLQTLKMFLRKQNWAKAKR